MFHGRPMKYRTHVKKINPIISTSPVSYVRILQKLTFHLAGERIGIKICSNRQAIFPQTRYNENIHISPQNTSELMPYYDTLYDH